MCPFEIRNTLNLYSHMFRENQVKACDAVANALSFTNHTKCINIEDNIPHRNIVRHKTG